MKLYQLLMLTALIILVIMGLNVSNEGINNLTRQERQAVLDIDYDGEGIKLEAMGNSHSYSLDRLENITWPVIKEWGEEVVSSCVSYLKKIWTIFDVVFLT